MAVRRQLNVSGDASWDCQCPSAPSRCLPCAGWTLPRGSGTRIDGMSPIGVWAAVGCGASDGRKNGWTPWPGSNDDHLCFVSLWAGQRGQGGVAALVAPACVARRADSTGLIGHGPGEREETATEGQGRSCGRLSSPWLWQWPRWRGRGWGPGRRAPWPARLRLAGPAPWGRSPTPGRRCGRVRRGCPARWPVPATSCGGSASTLRSPAAASTTPRRWRSARAGTRCLSRGTAISARTSSRSPTTPPPAPGCGPAGTTARATATTSPWRWPSAAGAATSPSHPDAVTLADSDAIGARRWVSRYHGYSNDYAAAVAVSPGGDAVYVTGGSDSRGGIYDYKDYATIAYDAATGATLWGSRYNGPIDGDDSATAVARTPRPGAGGASP